MPNGFEMEKSSLTEGVDAGTDTDVRCAYCGTTAPIIWVHGHGQCAHCGINVEECCRGEQCMEAHRNKRVN